MRVWAIVLSMIPVHKDRVFGTDEISKLEIKIDIKIELFKIVYEYLFYGDFKTEATKKLFFDQQSFNELYKFGEGYGMIKIFPRMFEKLSAMTQLKTNDQCIACLTRQNVDKIMFEKCVKHILSNKDILTSDNYNDQVSLKIQQKVLNFLAFYLN